MASDGHEERDRDSWDVATKRAAWWRAALGEVEPHRFSKSLIRPAYSDVNKIAVGGLTASPRQLRTVGQARWESEQFQLLEVAREGDRTMVPNSS
jgi:hypothetical protein